MGIDYFDIVSYIHFDNLFKFAPILIFIRRPTLIRTTCLSLNGTWRQFRSHDDSVTSGRGGHAGGAGEEAAAIGGEEEEDGIGVDEQRLLGRGKATQRRKASR